MRSLFGWQLIKSESKTKNVKQSICFSNKIDNQFHSNLSIPFNHEIRKYMYCVHLQKIYWNQKRLKTANLSARKILLKTL